MKIRSAMFTMAGLTALALPELAGAQSSPPVSQQRIRVTKESSMTENSSGNRSSIARTDSINRANSMRADSIANVERMRRDSITAAETRKRDSVAAAERARADSVARVERDRLAAIEKARLDSIAAVEAAAAAERERIQRERDRYRFDGSGWYMALEGGGAVPNDDFKDLGYNSGYALTIPIGYQKRDRLLGVRLDLGYSQFSGSNFIGQGPSGSTVTITNGNPKVLSAVLNLTAALPLGSSGLSLYGVGGGGMYHFRDFGPTSALSGFLGNDVIEQNEVANLETTRNKWGAQGGAGIDFGRGPASIYVESRFVNVWADRDDNVQFKDFYGNRSGNLQWIPIVLGVKIR